MPDATSNLSNTANDHIEQSFPPLQSLGSELDRHIQIKDPLHCGSSDEEISDDEGSHSSSPFKCLFCDQGFEVDDIGLATNLEHMRSIHTMSIPNPEMLVDIQSFVEYLATVVRTLHECIYCGATKSSTLGIQSHMRDKGHCLLNFDREPELFDFWDSSRTEQERPTAVSTAEVRFASGKVISSRHATLAVKSSSRYPSPSISTMIALPTHPRCRETLSSSKQLSRRDQVSMVGVSMQQRQALVLAEKKAQRSEAAAGHAREWMHAKGANSQKFDQVDNQMKWGKQNHKLQPR